MKFASHEEWRAQKQADMAELNPLLECPECDGEGVEHKECCECGHESERDCESCDTSGRIHYNDLAEDQWAHLFSYSTYFKELIQTVRDVSEFCARDFFDTCCEAIKASGRATYNRY